MGMVLGFRWVAGFQAALGMGSLKAFACMIGAA